MPCAQIPRGPGAVIPALIVPVFFFIVNVGALQKVAAARAARCIDFKAFQLPVAIIFAVTGVSRASTLVTDIQGGYFDRLLLTPVRRLALLLGLMVADFALVIALAIPVVVLGLRRSASASRPGPLGIVVFLLLAGLVGPGLHRLPLRHRAEDRQPGRGELQLHPVLPVRLPDDDVLAEEQLTGWLSTIATYNPVTYLLAGLRSLIFTGWDGTALGQALLAIGGVSVVSLGLALAALRGRVRDR